MNEIDFVEIWSNVCNFFFNFSNSVKCPFLWSLLFIGLPVSVISFLIGLFSEDKNGQKD